MGPPPEDALTNAALSSSNPTPQCEMVLSWSEWGSNIREQSELFVPLQNITDVSY